MTRFFSLMMVACMGGATADPNAVKLELLENVDAIRNAEIDLLVVGEFTPCESKEQATQKTTLQTRIWAGDKCWSDIGWAPNENVYGGYWVTVVDGSFTVHGVGPDLGDGKPIHIIATQQKTAYVQP